MSSLEAELAGQDRDQVPEIKQKGLRLVFIPFSKIRQFTGHPFRLYIGERLSDMVESVRQNGILMPLIVRRIFDDGEHDYEMLSGHNRMNAGQIAGLDGAWCLVKEGLTDAEALMYVIETNMLQRSFSDLLPSEKAAVLAMRYSEMFSQGTFTLKEDGDILFLVPFIKRRQRDTEKALEHSLRLLAEFRDHPEYAVEYKIREESK